jgi:hypothetical protein
VDGRDKPGHREFEIYRFTVLHVKSMNRTASGTSPVGDSKKERRPSVSGSERATNNNMGKTPCWLGCAI